MEEEVNNLPLKCLTWIFFLRKYLAYGMYKPIPQRKNFQKKLKKISTRFFLGPKVLLFCLKSVPWTGNELAGDDVENCENSQLTLTNLSHLL